MMGKRFHFILKTIKGYRVLFALLFFSVLATSVTASIMPYLNGEIVNEIFYSNYTNTFVVVIIEYGGIYILNQSLHLLLNYTWAKLKVTYLVKIRRNIFVHVVKLSCSDYIDLKSGDIIKRIGSDVENILELIHRNIFYLFGKFLDCMLSVIFVLYINYKVGLIILVMVPIQVILVNKMSKKLSKAKMEKAQIEASLSSWLFEMINGKNDIFILNAIKKVKKDYSLLKIKALRRTIECNRRSLQMDFVSRLMSLVVQLLIYVTIAISLFNGGSSIGALIACVAYFDKCVSALESLIEKVPAIAEQSVSIDRVIEIMDYGIEEKLGTVGGRSKIKEINFRNVSFKYKESREILRNVDFKASENMVIAIVGESGVGKSSLTFLMNRLYDIESGDIMYNGKNINDYSLHELRAAIGIVQQDVLILPGTIRYNISLSNDKLSDERIWKVLEMVELKKTISALPESLDTYIKDANHIFSGGEKQRISIARQLYKDADVLILDEATSSLDPETEKHVYENIYKWNTGKIVIIITHRIPTIRNVDKIFQMSDGKIIAQGTFDELLEQSKEFYNLYMHFLESETIDD
ncbi:ABC transporter ATP-binding protein [Ihubacter sp. rT4E-8]|uniref:ABC transporter ATP-binding protein n=1 Tax=Ihubacter sp. rT4E-8 TaxID=3242369 RepID=UPI003CED6DBF